MRCPPSNRSIPALVTAVISVVAATAAPAQDNVVSFESRPNQIKILVDDQPFATYVYRDDAISRPHFTHLYAPGGIQVTRNHPPVPNVDSTDHASMHPGLWFAFGDIDGADFWRNRATVRHVEFLRRPQGGPGRGSFAVENVYEDDGEVVCREHCLYTIIVQPSGYLLIHDSVFFNKDKAFTFGDQEEMGLGVRVATPLAVEKGGKITNSAGQKNEAEAWGNQADWCDYSGLLNERRVGVVLMNHPENFRRPWFHARDYGFVAANPFGRNAFTGGEKSAVTIQPGETLRLRYSVFFYATDTTDSGLPERAYNDYLALVEAEL